MRSPPGDGGKGTLRGRKRTLQNDPTLLADLDELNTGPTATWNRESLLRWTTNGIRQSTVALRSFGEAAVTD